MTDTMPFGHKTLDGGDLPAYGRVAGEKWEAFDMRKKYRTVAAAIASILGLGSAGATQAAKAATDQSAIEEQQEQATVQPNVVEFFTDQFTPIKEPFPEGGQQLFEVGQLVAEPDPIPKGLHPFAHGKLEEPDPKGLHPFVFAVGDFFQSPDPAHPYLFAGHLTGEGEEGAPLSQDFEFEGRLEGPIPPATPPPVP